MCHGAAALVPITLYCDNELPAPNGSRGLRNRHAVCSGGASWPGWRRLCSPRSFCPRQALPLLLICWRRRRRKTRPARGVGTGREVGSGRGVSGGRCAEPGTSRPGTPTRPAASFRVRLSLCHLGGDEGGASPGATQGPARAAGGGRPREPSGGAGGPCVTWVESARGPRSPAVRPRAAPAVPQPHAALRVDTASCRHTRPHQLTDESAQVADHV